MRNFSNTYIFIFSAAMVILVAALLSLVAMQLKPRQELNVRVETMQNILNTVRIESTKKNAEEIFKENVAESYVIDSKGSKIEGLLALDIDLKKEVAKIDKIKKLRLSIAERKVSPFKAFISTIISSKEIDKTDIERQIDETASERYLPVYIINKGSDRYTVFPLRGKGLWGPVWGFVALESDMNTIYGAVFDHKAETPGLGAEITESWFEDDFIGKKIMKDGRFTSVEVVKGGTDDDNPYGVDAISGGTITSKGVEDMIYDCLGSYQAFFELQRN